MDKRKIKSYGTMTYLISRVIYRVTRDQLTEKSLGPILRDTFKHRSLSISEDISFSDLLEMKAERNGDHPFLHYQDQVVTLRQLNERSNRVAHALKESGARPGEGVGIMMSNCPEFLYAFYALQKLGMYAIPINTQLKGDGLAYIITHSEIKYVFFDQTVSEEIQKIRDKTAQVREFICFRGEAPAGFSLPPGSRDCRELLDPKYPVSNPGISYDRNNMCIIMYTSGTTGLPKGVVYRYIHSGVRRLGMGSLLLYSKNDILYTCLPLFHANALWVTVTQAMWAGAQVALSKRFSARRFWDEIRQYRATTFNCLGAMAPILLKQPPDPKDKEHNVRFILSSACPPEAAEPFEKRFGVQLWETYGAVDGGGMVTFNVGNAPYGSIGKPMFGIKYRLVNEEMKDVPVGEPGELVFWVGEKRESSVEYLKDQKATSQKMRDGWLHTGDLISRDKDDYLYFRGRASDYMRRRGENVSAYEVESQVINYPAVLECAVYGVPSEMGEDDIMTTIVPREGQKIDLPDLVRFLAEKLPRFAVPRYINVVDKLPKTETHRVQKNILKAQGITSSTWDREKYEEEKK
jgi:crotonobetaine/carnitine-CoA ligase